MELIYVYVKNFKGIIKDFEYNFSDKYEIKCDKDVKELEVLRADSEGTRFFGDKIRNITAIIGKNGAGKSSILKVLSMKYNDLKERNDEYILIYHIRENIFYIESFQEVLDRLNIKPMKEEYQINKQNYLKGVYVELLDGKFISINKLNNEIKDTCIIASLNTVVNDYGSSEEIKVVPRIGLRQGWEFQYRFLTHAKENKYDAKENKYDAKENKYDAYKNDIRIEIFINNRYKFNDSLMNVNDRLFEMYIDKFSSKEVFILSLIYQQIKRISIEVINYYKNSESENIEKDIQEWFNHIDKNNYEESINYAKNTYKKILSYINQPTYNNINEENNEQYLINTIDSLNDLDANKFVDDYLSIEISDKEDCNVVKFFHMLDNGEYRGYSDITKTLNIEINHLSDGEHAFLKLFASIYSKIGEYKNIILALDEPDKNFHPEWSRRFITYLMDNLDIFDTKQIKRVYQIILTTHSPFIASDLPKNNIMTIKNCEKKEMNLGNTFGANIHMLLSNQFFMESTIGEFARKKINQCIDELNKKIKDSAHQIGHEKKNEIEYIIENVGEPIIKNKLSNMYREAFPTSKNDYIYKINKLEEEKSKLEKLLKDKKLDNIDEIMDFIKKQIYELKKKSGESK